MPIEKVQRKTSSIRRKLYIQTFKGLAQHVEVDKSTISRRLQATGKIQKEERWLPPV